MESGRIVKMVVVGIICLVIGFFVYRNWDYWTGRMVDHNVSMKGPTPVHTTNGQNRVIYLFADGQGKLTVTEDLDGDGKIESVTFAWVDQVPQDSRVSRLGNGRLPPKPPLEMAIDQISDSVRRMWVKNVLMTAPRNGGPTSFVVLASLDKDQSATEADKRKALQTQLALIDDGSKDGTKDPAAYRKVMSAIDQAKANTNEPDVDLKKADLIRAVIAAAKAYNEKMDSLRIAEAERYVDDVQKLLTPDQHQHMDEVVKERITTEEQLASAQQQGGAMPQVAGGGRRANQNPAPQQQPRQRGAAPGGAAPGGAAPGGAVTPAPAGGVPN